MGEEGVRPGLRPCGSDVEEAETIVSGILERLSTTDHVPSDIAILYRTNALSRVLERSLRAAGVPYRLIGAVQFFARKEIKDLLAFLRLKAHPYDLESFLRVVNTPPRGIGEKSQAQLRAAAQATSEPLIELIADPERRPRLKGAAVRGLQQLGDLLAWIRDEPGDDLVALLQEVLDRTSYLQHLRDSDSLRGDERVENVRELLADLDEYQREAEEPSVRDYLEQRALVQDADGVDSGGSQVQLMTLHSSKGLEFRSVFLCGLEEDTLPHRRSVEEGDVEEERRLFYVGITRARERLDLSYAGRRFQFGSAGFMAPSRFLHEVPSELFQGASVQPSFDGFIPDPGVADDPFVDAEAYADADPALVIDHEVADADPWEEALEVGDRVEHERFGRGRILGVEGRGDRIRIDFDGVVKTVQLGFARMRKVQEYER